MSREKCFYCEKGAEAGTLYKIDNGPHYHPACGGNPTGINGDDVDGVEDQFERPNLARKP